MSDKEFDAIYRSLFNYACQILIRKGCSQSEAQDLTQDVFLRVYKSWGSYRGEASHKSWVRTITLNVWKNHLRNIKSQKRQGQSISLDELTAEPKDIKNPEKETINKHLLKHLDEALNNLPKKMRIILLLRIRKDLKYREIADLMGVKIDTVKAHLHDAKKRLESHFKPSFPNLKFEIPQKTPSREDE